MGKIKEGYTFGIEWDWVGIALYNIHVSLDWNNDSEEERRWVCQPKTNKLKYKISYKLTISYSYAEAYRGFVI